ncbi:helix-turn-helix domain-containing protein [Salinilacihabitans rarus]|uniref:helix-turn-helix domain-containing protein n=1 Tax=Salinilacihabitans rarus TaxID=2961596 RepID=UPI0020C8C727|nr:helix-turn-helix domain-containing protein [Salinilacihabitans rarus]
MSTDAADSRSAGVQSRADGGIIAEVRLDHPDLVLRPTLERLPTAVVEPEYWTTLDDGRTLAFFTVSETSYDEFEAALDVDPTVADPALVDRYPDRRIYRVELVGGTVGVVAATAECGGRILDLVGNRDGWTVQLRLPDRESLVALNEFCRERGVTFRVNHLRLSDDGEDGVVGLTPKQQRLLTVAYEEGYFDVPRGISQDELADRLDVSKSAISQRLRRAIAQLCASSIGKP